jgi:hypothetical protein
VLPSGAVRPLNRVFLHAAWIELGAAERIESPLPDVFSSLWLELGGDPAALDRAKEIELVP